MANTHKIFQALRMASQDVVSYDRSIVCTSDLDNGSLVIETVPATNIYGTNEMDVYVATAPAAVATDRLLIVDSGDVARIEGFKINVVDPRYNYVPANVVAKARQLIVGDEFAQSAAAFTSAPTVGEYVYGVNGSTLWSASGNLASTASHRCYAYVVSAWTFSVGKTNVSGYKLRVEQA